MTGYSKDEAIGKKFNTFDGSPASRPLLDRIWTTLRRGELWAGRMTSRKKSGELLHLEATFSPVCSSAGGITNYVAVSRDVTQEMDLHAQLRQAQKMEALGTLAGGIAHDFNNILGIMIGFMELAMLELPEDSEARKHLNDARKGGHRASRLVKQILAFSREREQPQGPIQVGLVVKEALKMLRSTLPATIEIEQAIDSSSQVMGDPSQVYQIIMNLCTNAHHAMREAGGVMSVSLKDVYLTGPMDASHMALAPGQYLELIVADTGCGIDPDIGERVFDPYFTTKPSGEGTGLGLAVVHGIVKRLGGAISFQSEIGKGTQFRLLLPVCDVQMYSEGGVSEMTPQGNQEQVLFIDDEEQLVFLAEKMLRRLGYRVTGCSNSVQALQEFRSNPQKFDIIVTDMTMPHMTGMQLAEEFLRIRPGIPLILCTGFSELVRYEKVTAAGFKSFIMKPLDIEDLARTIARLLGKEPTDPFKKP